MQRTDELLSEHYAHLSSKPFFQRVKDSMMATPVIVCCYEGVDAIQKQSVRWRDQLMDVWLRQEPFIRDYSMSFQENIVHTSDSPETAAIELTNFLNLKRYSTTNRRLLTTCMRTTNIN